MNWRKQNKVRRERGVDWRASGEGQACVQLMLTDPAHCTVLVFAGCGGEREGSLKYIVSAIEEFTLQLRPHTFKGHGVSQWNKGVHKPEEISGSLMSPGRLPGRGKIWTGSLEAETAGKYRWIHRDKNQQLPKGETCKKTKKVLSSLFPFYSCFWF